MICWQCKLVYTYTNLNPSSHSVNWINRIDWVIQLQRQWKNYCQNMHKTIYRVCVHGLIMSNFIFVGLLLCTLLILLILFAITSTAVSSIFFSFPWFSLCSISNVLTIFLDIRSGDCKDQYGEKGRCVVGAIYNYTNQLLDYGKETPCKPFLRT